MSDDFWSAEYKARIVNDLNEATEDNRYLRQQLNETRQELDQLRKDLAECQHFNDVLRSRLRELRKKLTVPADADGQEE